MLQRNLSLPFKTEDAYSGLASVQGMIRFEPKQLVLEYQVKDNIVGMLKSGTKELRIPFENLNELTYKVNWFISRLKLHVNSMRILGEFPVGKDGIITLRINRKQRQTAREIVSQVNLRLSELRLEMLGGDD